VFGAFTPLVGHYDGIWPINMIYKTCPKVVLDSFTDIWLTEVYHNIKK